MKKEIIYGGIGIVIGSLLGFYLEISQSLSFIALIIFILIYLKSSKAIAFALLALGLSCFIMQVNEESQSLNLYERANIEASIEEVLKNTEDYSSYRLKVTSLDGEKIKENALIYIYEPKEYKVGQIIRARAKVNPLLDAGNPEVFNYKTYMRRHKIYTKLETASADVIGEDSSFTRRIKNNFTSYIDTELARGLSEENKGLMLEVFTGISSVEKEDKKDFSELGISHLLAISGLHIGIITFFLAFIFNLLGLHKTIVDLLCLILLLVYIYLIDFPASAVRAFIMTCFLTFSRIFKKAYDPKKALGASVFLMVLINPYRIFDMGLILSVFATLALIYKDKLVNIKADSYISKTFKLSLSINIFLLPFFINNFNSFNFLSFLANLLIIPLFTIAVVSGLVKLILGIFLPSISLYLGYFVNQSMEIIRYISAILLEVKLFSFDFASLGLGLYIIYYFILYIYINRYDFSDLSYSFKINIFKIISINMISYLLFSLVMDPVEVEFLDVGQADSILIRGQNDRIMIDTGGSFLGEGPYKYKLRDYLLTLIKDPIPVIITHHDLDHSGNLAYMKDDGLVGKVYTSKYHKNPDEFGLEEGDSFKVGSGELLVLYDGRDAVSSNDSSLIMKLNYHGSSVLFTGDAEEFAENKILNKDIESDILKLGHHGSKSSSSEEFLDRVGPRAAIISVGKNNRYNHPSPEVIHRLRERNIEVLRTDESGRIKLVINRFTYYLTSYLPRTISILDFIILSSLFILVSIIYYEFLKSLYNASGSFDLFLRGK